jgi:hypothetical protein
MELFSGTPRYRPRRRIGAGTAGVVYEVWDRERDRAVALKLLHRSDPGSLYRFKKEFRALAHLSHPNLARLHELEHAGGQWFVTMELVDGVDFVRHVRAPEAVAAGAAALAARLRPLAGQLARGLRALHASGRLHRDVKPSNVLVGGDGRVVILDFGLVTEAAALQTYASFSEDLLGTPAYMAPEQGSGQELTEAADWYGVGTLLYEALTGRPPFSGQFVTVMLDKMRREPAPPRALVPDVAEDLDALCRDLLRLDPAARPDGAEVLERLGAEDDTATLRTPQILAPPFLVGRDAELAALGRAYERTRAGDAVVLYVRGAAGTGKSALVHHFLLELRRRHPRTVTLTGGCYERESVPFKALDSVIDKLTRYLRSLGEGAARLLPLDVEALARLFPVLRRVGAVAAAPARRPPAREPAAEDLRRRAFAALREILTRLAEDDPLVVFIDDLQWGDAESAELLSAVLGPPDPPPLCLVAAYRDDAGRDAGPLVRALRAGPHALPGEDLAVGELAPAHAEELAARLLDDFGGSPTAARRIARGAGGRPRAIDDAVRRALEHGEFPADR